METDGGTPPTEFLDSSGLGSAGESAFLTGPQAMLLLLVYGPHFKNHGSSPATLPGIYHKILKKQVLF